MAWMCDQTYGIERPADHVVRISLPEDPPVACARVEAGDTVILPFAESDTMWMVETDGYLVIGDEGATLFLQGYVQAADDAGNQTVIVAERDGTPIDVAIVLAATFPNLDITP